jgi:hypothetical protein
MDDSIRRQSANEDYDEMKKMYLHSILEIRNNITVLRVPDGWLYMISIEGNVTSSFVPE